MSWAWNVYKKYPKKFVLFFRNVTVIKRNHTTTVDVDETESKAIGTNENVCVWSQERVNVVQFLTFLARASQLRSTNKTRLGVHVVSSAQESIINHLLLFSAFAAFPHNIYTYTQICYFFRYFFLFFLPSRRHIYLEMKL